MLPYALWQLFFVELKAKLVKPYICQVGQPICHSEDKKHDRIDAEGNGRVAPLDLAEGHARDKGPLRHDGRRNSPPQPGAADVRAELVEGALYGERQGWNGTHRIMTFILSVI